MKVLKTFADYSVKIKQKQKLHFGRSPEIVYDPSKVSYEELAKLFFNIHDPTQINRQGPDIGHQYRSAVYYTSKEQKLAAQKLIDQLKENGYDVVTELELATKFYEAEDYHQQYYLKKGSLPYCHTFQNRFE